MKINAKLLTITAVPVILWLVPAPGGLSVAGWHLFALYVAAILGLIFRPIPEGIILLGVIGISSLLLGNAPAVLSGFSSPITWLVFSAFALGASFIKTGLGARFAYILIGRFGGSTLRLGYVNAILELVLAPVMPSNTARAGGVIAPIMESITKELGSQPGPTAERAGAFLISNVNFLTKVSSFMFLTGMAPNLLANQYLSTSVGFEFTWGSWFLAMFVPGLILLFITPLVGYCIYQPSIKKIDHLRISREGLEALGPMKPSEKVLLVIFLAALGCWSLPTILELTGIHIKINAMAIALLSMIACVVSGILSWDEMLQNKPAWNTFVWFGSLIGISNALVKLDFFQWIDKQVEVVSSWNIEPFNFLILIAVASILVRYLFSTDTVYIASMLPIFLALGKNAGVDITLMALILTATNSFGGTLTQYSGAASLFVFSLGYNDVKRWWLTGTINAALYTAFIFTFGIFWWRLVGLLG